VPRRAGLSRHRFAISPSLRAGCCFINFKPSVPLPPFCLLALTQWPQLLLIICPSFPPFSSPPPPTERCRLPSLGIDCLACLLVLPDLAEASQLTHPCLWLRQLHSSGTSWLHPSYPVRRPHLGPSAPPATVDGAHPSRFACFPALLATLLLDFLPFLRSDSRQPI
jgi:hypothetical protein